MYSKTRAVKTSLPVIVILAALLILVAGCSPEEKAPDGRLHLTYWDKWTGFEFEARQKVVDLFNHSQDRIYVELLSISQIERKLTVAIAGGNPPDIAGLFSEYVPVFAQQNAMLPLDGYLERYGISPDDFLDAYWKKMVYEGYTWAVPTCGAALAFHYNKGLFREAGLDPEKPPVTLDELKEIEKKLNVIKGNRIERVAFLPSEPNWWPYCWPWFFGGHLWDGKDKLTLTSPEVVEAYEWVAGYSQRLGVERVQAFRSGFGNLFASPQNPFLAGTVASELQGNWLINFVEKYNPGMEFGVAPMPTKTRDLYGTTIAESDIIFIPNGAKHPDESFEFIRFVTNQECTEMFCSEMRAISPRRIRSENYLKNHLNPNIELFEKMVMGGKTRSTPQIPLWYEIQDEMIDVFDKVWLHQMTALEALSAAQKRLQARFDQDQERWEKVASKRKEKWDAFVKTTRERKLPS